MEQSFSPTQQDESCVIRAGWRNSAERLVTVYGSHPVTTNQWVNPAKNANPTNTINS
jgi:hypothetical protein